MNKYTLLIAGELLAKRPSILDRIPTCAWAGQGMTQWDTWESIAIGMADMLEDADKKFNRLQFCQLCGLSESNGYAIMSRSEIAHTLGYEK